jgi:hypothetical protein
MMTSRSLICLLEIQNGGKLQKLLFQYNVSPHITFADSSVIADSAVASSGNNNDSSTKTKLKWPTKFEVRFAKRSSDLVGHTVSVILFSPTEFNRWWLFGFATANM